MAFLLRERRQRQIRMAAIMAIIPAATAIPISAPLESVIVAVPPPLEVEGRPPALVLVAVAVAAAPEAAVVMVVTPPPCNVLVTLNVLAAVPPV